MKFSEFNTRTHTRSAILLRHRTDFAVWRLRLFNVVKVFSMTRVQLTVANLRFSSCGQRGEGKIGERHCAYVCFILARLLAHFTDPTASFSVLETRVLKNVRRGETEKEKKPRKTKKHHCSIKSYSRGDDGVRYRSCLHARRNNNDNNNIIMYEIIKFPRRSVIGYVVYNHLGYCNSITLWPGIWGVDNDLGIAT